jgi:hypothetical protein
MDMHHVPGPCPLQKVIDVLRDQGAAVPVLTGGEEPMGPVGLSPGGGGATVVVDRWTAPALRFQVSWLQT